MAFDEDQKKCGGITLGGLLTLILGGCLIGVGANYFVDGPVSESQEPCMKCIPIAMMTGGCIFIASLVLRFVLQRCCRKMGEIGSDDKLCSSLNFACKFSFIFLFDTLVTVVYLIWLIIFTVMTLQIHGSISFVDGDSSTAVISDNIGDVGTEQDTTYECNVVLYDSAFWLVIVLWVLFVFAVTCGLLAKFCACFYNILCCKPCKRAEENRENV